MRTGLTGDRSPVNAMTPINTKDTDLDLNFTQYQNQAVQNRLDLTDYLAELLNAFKHLKTEFETEQSKRQSAEALSNRLKYRCKKQHKKIKSLKD
jgi:hypothetical protein